MIKGNRNNWIPGLQKATIECLAGQAVSLMSFEKLSPGKMSLRKALGWCLLVVSTIAWIVLPAIPFLPLSVDQKAAWGGSLFIFAEITWWAALPLLGKEFIDWSKQLWQQCKQWLSTGGERQKLSPPDDQAP